MADLRAQFEGVLQRMAGSRRFSSLQEESSGELQSRGLSLSIADGAVMRQCFLYECTCFLGLVQFADDRGQNVEGDAEDRVLTEPANDGERLLDGVLGLDESAPVPLNARYLWDLPDAAAGVFVSRGASSGDLSVPVSGSLQALGGAISRVDADATAFSHRGADFDFMSTTTWADTAEDDERRRGVRRFADAMAPFGHGVYVNNLGVEGEDRVREAYRRKKYARLAAIKRRYDPDNVFHFNQNIKPAGRERS